MHSIDKRNDSEFPNIQEKTKMSKCLFAKLKLRHLWNHFYKLQKQFNYAICSFTSENFWSIQKI